jgi:hypothetical protein
MYGNIVSPLSIQKKHDRGFTCGFSALYSQAEGPMRFKNVEEKHLFKTRKERKILSGFLEEETLMAQVVLALFRQKQVDPPDDVYRGLAYFINEEWIKKPGSLCLLYETKKSVEADMPPVIKETAFDQACYFLKAYCAVLTKEGY